MQKIKTNPVRTILTITVGFAIIYSISDNRWALLISVIIGLVGIFSDYLSKVVDSAWMKLSWLLSLIVPNILLGITYYLILFPISVLSKIFGQKDPLKLKNNSNTLFKTVKKEFNKASFEKPW